MLDYSDYLGRPDFLGKAAKAGHAAKAAIKSGEYDKAWGLLHEQKSLYGQHAARSGWQQRDLLSLDGSVSEKLADILRLEKKHDQALVHIIYWITSSRSVLKRHDSKLRAYFNRCKFEAAKIEDARRFIDESAAVDFGNIQTLVSNWRQDN